MKKYVALLLCLLLIFSFGVPSFATEISGSVTVTNFPAYFTGAYDNSISAELIAIHNYLDMYLGDIWLYTDRIDDNVQLIYENSLMFFNASVEQMQIELEFYSYVMNMIGSINGTCLSINDYLRNGLTTSMNSGFSSVVSAVNGTTGAVGSFHSSFTEFGQTWEDEFLMKDNPGTVGYQLKMLQAVLADEKDLEMKEASADAEEGLFENFVSPSGKGSVGSDDMGSLLDLSGWFSNFFGGSFGTKPNQYIKTSIYSLNQTFNDTSDTGAFGWFTQANADAMDTVVSSYGRNVNPATSPVLATHYYEDKLEELESVKEMFSFG